ncbi:MAG: IS1595 family transposase [Ketobacter sp.]|nr:IS1595 family transposase [Ketobacter sp.]
MAKNAVQFQEGFSLPDFFGKYGSEGQCEKALYDWRWPSGFVCPQCGHTRHCLLNTNQLYQCYNCHHQTSLTSGTIFANTKLPLTIWFLAMFLVTQTKNGVSALELKRHLGVSYCTAWSIKHKLMQVMKEREDGQTLQGIIQMDDAYWGGERHGGKRGRGAPHKVPFVAAVSTNEAHHPIGMRFTKLKRFSKAEIADWAHKHLESSCKVFSDGLDCFRAVTQAGCEHVPIITGSGPDSVKHEEFTWVNTMLGNVKKALNGTYHNVSEEHLPRYLAEFCYRFDRRFNLASMFERLGYVAVRTPPMPLRLLTLAEQSG